MLKTIKNSYKAIYDKHEKILRVCDKFLKKSNDTEAELVFEDDEKNKVALVQSDDWEGLYINKKLVKEGHTLNEGNSRIKYFVKLAKQYNFNLEDLEEFTISEEDKEETNNIGCLPENIANFKELIKDE